MIPSERNRTYRPVVRLVTLGIAALLFISFSSCRFFSSEGEGADEESPQPAPGPRPGGDPQPGSGCRNFFVKGNCEFVRIWPLKMREPQEGVKLYRVIHKVAQGDEVHTLHPYNLRIREDREEDLRQYFTKNSPVPCEAQIITPPCNPASSRYTIELEPPPYAAIERD